MESQNRKTGRRQTETDRQTVIQTDRKTYRQTDRQADGRTDRQTDRQTNRQKNVKCCVLYVSARLIFWESRRTEYHTPWPMVLPQPAYLVCFLVPSATIAVCKLFPSLDLPGHKVRRKTIFLLWLLVIFAQMHENEIHALWKYPNYELIIIISEYFNWITLQYKSTVINGVL